MLPTLLVAVMSVTATALAETPYERDVAFALEEIGKQCKELLDRKKIDWKKVGKEFTSAARKSKTDQDHMVLLTRLLARLEDGHSGLQPGPATKDLKWPEDGPFGVRDEPVGCGMFWCRIGEKVYVKDVWKAAEQVGLQVDSNKDRCNKRREIEGIGVISHEIVEFDAKDLAAGVDTLIRRADELLANFPEKDVPYRAP
jgi:hypothetical protein